MQKRTALCLLFTGLQVLDTVSTCKFVAEFGLEAEVNPVMRVLIYATGMAGFVLAKAAVTAYFLYIQTKARLWVLWFANLIMLPVALLAALVAWS